MGRFDPLRDGLEELLEEVDQLLLEETDDEDVLPEEDEDGDFDPDEYAPARENDEVLMVYRNFSNGYGSQIRNFSNGYGSGIREENPGQAPRPMIPAYNADLRRIRRDQSPADRKAVARTEIPAYNADIRRLQRQQSRQAAPESGEEAPRAPKPRKKAGCGWIAVVLLGLLAGAVWFFLSVQS